MTTTQPVMIVPPPEDRERDRAREVEAQEMEVHDAREAQGAAPASGEATPHAELGTSYLPDRDSAQASDRWQRIQAEFVDDPRKSVGQAHELVGELMQRIVDAFAHERRELERQWSKGDDVSTEDLRVCLQRYRAFFSRLLPLEQST